MASRTQNTNDQGTVYRSAFAALERRLNGEASSAVHALRRAALQRFETVGFPTTRDEEWRFTNITPIAATPFEAVLERPKALVAPEMLARWTFPGINAHRVVFVNGHFSPVLSAIGSLPPRVTVGSLAEALSKDGDRVAAHLGKYAPVEESAFTALSTAFMQDGAYIVVPDKTVLKEPIHLLYFCTGDGKPFMAHPRNLFVIGKQSKVSIVESFIGNADHAYLTNTVTEMVVGEETVVEHDKLQLESPLSYHIGTTHIRMEKASTLTSNAVALGGSIVRNTITAVLGAEGIECTLNGLSLGTGTQLIDNHTVIDHARPNCASHELYKAVLDGTSRGVFNGKIFVRKDAQKTDAKQTNKTLLLSDDATIDTKPQLEIFADDVKCTHGATVGQLDEEQVFYLRTRGIGESDARDILTFAFASDIVSRVHVAPLREQLEALIRRRLRQGRITTEA
jgi:Fe-S cluster assembly protein SufD